MTATKIATSAAQSVRSGLRYLFAVLAMLLAFGLSVVEFVAIIDPVGTKMADDGDPFGTPPTWISHVAIFAIVVAFLAGAAWLLRERKTTAV